MRLAVSLLLFLAWVLEAMPPNESAFAVFQNPNGPETSPAGAAVSSPSEFLVRFRSESSAAGRQNLLQQVGSQAKFFQPPGLTRAPLQKQRPETQSIWNDLAVIQLPTNARERTRALARLRQDPDVLYIEPNFRLRIAQAAAPPQNRPNDFEFSKLWGLHNTGQNGGIEDADIDAPEAWASGTGSRQIKVAVIDTGIDYHHPDLVANLWVNQAEIPGNGIDDDQNGYVDDVHGYDFVSNDRDPIDDQSHGTHVAGTIGATGNNTNGITGVCWQVSLMALKAFNETGGAEMDQVIQAIRYAIDNGARIINASWGGTDRSRALEEAIANAYEAGVLFVAAAGSERNDNPFYPAAYPYVLAVAATDPSDMKAFFSNFGAYVDVAAPGENIHSTTPNNRYDSFSGTSMAAPHVSGTAALVLANHPEFTNADLENILRNSVDPISSEQLLGAGRINAYQALRINTPLPIAQLSLPATISGSIPIRGTAKGNRFTGYALHYGKGIQPTNWIQFHSAAQPVDQAILFNDFYTPQLEEGTYTIRLTVENADGYFAVDRASVKVRNVQISFPLDNDFLRAGDLIPISGTVFGQNRTYHLEYSRGRQSTEWSDTGIELSQGGKQEILDGTLALWDTRELSGNEFYNLRLTAKNDRTQSEEVIVAMIYLDGQVRPGWPQYLPVVGEYPVESWRDINVADLDQDGFQELVLVDHGNSDGKPARLLVYRYDGRLWWSKELGSGQPFTDVPVLGDVDGDGFVEIFVDAGAEGRLFGFQFDGRPLPGNWPLRLGTTQIGKVLADLDGDGTLELIAYTQRPIGANAQGYRQLLIIDRAGNILRNWVLSSCLQSLDAPQLLPAVGNMDDDPDLEIVAVSDCNALSLYDRQRESGPVWTAWTEGTLMATPVIGDLDGDGTNEVVIAAYAFNEGYRGGIYAFKNDGGSLPGWPVLVEESFATAPALADFDGDGDLEISIPSWSSRKLHLVHHHGFSAEGWPVGPLLNSSVKSSTLIGDINADGQFDVILASPGLLSHAVRFGDLSMIGGVRAWSFSGKPIDLNPAEGLLPLVMESSGGHSSLKSAPVTLTDLDANGKLDLVVASLQDAAYFADGQPARRKNRSSIYIWELDVLYQPERFPWPTWQRNPQHTGSVEKPKHVNQPPSVGDIPDQIIPTGKTFFPIELDRYVEDPDQAAQTIEWRVEGNQELRVVVNQNRIVIIEPPDAEWSGQEILTFIAQDREGLQSSAVAIFAVKAGYQPPLAVDDHAITPEDTTVEIPLLINDRDQDGDPLSVASFSKPLFGRVKALADGRVSYEPKEDFFGKDSFNYLISDGRGGVAMASVVVEVLPVNDPPQAQIDRFITLEDAPVEIDLLANDSDPDGDPLDLVDFTQPVNGAIAISGRAKLLYTPKSQFYGLDQFTYRIKDPQGLESEGTVDLMVKPINDTPVALDQSFTLNRNSNREVAFLGEDADGDPLTYMVVKGPENGELQAYPALATYYPKKNFVGTDQFTYRASDGYQDSLEASVVFTVLDANNLPVAESQAVTTKQGQSLTINLSASDADEDPLTFQVVQKPAHGSIEAEGARVRYHPEPAFLGTDQFTFQVFDGKSSSAETKVSIKVTDVNTAPVAKNSVLDTKMNLATNLVLQASDGEGNPLTYTIVTPPEHGTLSGQAPNLVYAPATDFYGSDRVLFRASDGELESSLGTIWIVVRFPNDPPVAKDQILTLVRNTPAQVALTVTDADGDELDAPIFKGPQYGRLIGLGTVFTYVPKPEFVGSDSFTYKAWDGLTYGNEGKVLITVTAKVQPSNLSFLSIEAQPAGQMRLMLQTQPGKDFHIQTSSNLVDWESLITNQAEDATFLFIDTNSPNSNLRFYRAVQL